MKLTSIQMIQNLQGRKASAFARPDWQSRPFEKYTKGPEQKLYDIGEELAVLLAKADGARSTKTDHASTADRSNLLQDCTLLEDKLDAWFEQFSADVPAPHYWAEFSRLQNPVDYEEDRKLFPVSFHFPNIVLARVLLDYWAIAILLYGTSMIVFGSLAGQSKPPGPAHAPMDKHAQANILQPRSPRISLPRAIQNPNLIKSMADNICQSIEYCLAEDMGTLGSQWALFGLRVAMQTYLYTPDLEKHRWLKAIHDQISAEKGVKFSSTLAAYQWECTTPYAGDDVPLAEGLRRITGPHKAFGTGVGTR